MNISGGVSTLLTMNGLDANTSKITNTIDLLLSINYKNSTFAIVTIASSNMHPIFLNTISYEWIAFNTNYFNRDKYAAFNTYGISGVADSSNLLQYYEAS